MPTPSGTTFDVKWTRLPVRARPHRNPLADNDDEHPDCPDDAAASLASAFPGTPIPAAASSPLSLTHRQEDDTLFVDIGCAFAGMLIHLAPIFPSARMLGLEIRSKVVEFSQRRIEELRAAASDPTAAAAAHGFRNIWVEQLNVMKYGARYFPRSSIDKLFFCYPDPHWKRKNVRRRIVSPTLVHEYAFWLKDDGLVYTVSDVPELAQWMCECLDGCPLFERVVTTTSASAVAAPARDTPRLQLPEEFLKTYLAGERGARSSAAQENELLKWVVTSSEDAERAKRKGITPTYSVHRRIHRRPLTEQ